MTAKPGTTDSLNVSWTKPGLVGGPDIVGYNVRHQVTGSGSWSTVQLTGTGLTTMISGLESGTDYTVQVQARNGETPSLWSLDGEGTTATTTTTSSDASLSALALAESGGAAISLGETFVPATLTYTASVANGIDTVTLTATKNDSNATVVIASDDETGTPGVAELDLNVGSNTLTVTVTAQDGTTEQEYTITVTRAGATTADVVWSTTMTVGVTTGDGRGYRSSGEVRPGGSLDTDSFTTGGVPYRVLRLDVSGARGAAEFKLNSELSSYADYTLEFAGDAWLAANAEPAGHAARGRTAHCGAGLPRGTTTTTTPRRCSGRARPRRAAFDVGSPLSNTPWRGRTRRRSTSWLAANARRTAR